LEDIKTIEVGLIVDMDKSLCMGLKPLSQLILTNPFTKVNGNKINFFAILLPSALADGFS